MPEEDENAPQIEDSYEDDEQEEEVDVRVTGKKHQKPRVLLEWTGPSRVHVAREHNFFVTLFVAAVAAGFVLVLLKEYVLMLVVFALAFTIYAANKHEPRIVHYQITSTEIQIDEERFNYDDLKSFWFDEEGGQTVLKIATQLAHPHYIDLVISAKSRDAIEDELLEYIPYEKMHEGRLTMFIKRLALPIDNPQATAQPTAPQEPAQPESPQSPDTIQ